MRTIVWDVDDVLNDLMRVWLEDEWRVKHPGCPLSYEAVVENPPQALLGVSREEYTASLDGFRLSGRYARMTPSPLLKQWFMAHGARYHHVALTAVPLKAAGISADWVMSHFGQWVRAFHVVPSPRPEDRGPVYDRSKIDLLKRLGTADIFVDDMPVNLDGCEALGIRGVIFPRPWNNNRSPLEDVLSSLGAEGL